MIAAARLVSNAFRNEDLIFNGYALLVVTLCGIVVWRFVMYRRRIIDSCDIETPLATAPTPTQGSDHEL
jgi:hypothetical protein